MTVGATDGTSNGGKCLQWQCSFGLELTDIWLCTLLSTFSHAVLLILSLMLWPPNGAGHYILQLWFLPSFSSSFFLAYSEQLQIRCLPYVHTWCGLSANLECRYEMCCMQLAENTGWKNLPKICHLCNIAQLCWAISLQLRHVSTMGKTWNSNR